MRNILALLVLLVLSRAGYAGVAPSPNQASPAPDPQGAEEIYRQALGAYLDGNYDSAIILSVKSLEKDPGYAKSRSLLSILTSEKEQEGKTVIWLSGRPVIVTPTPAPAVPVAPVVQEDHLNITHQITSMQAHLDRFMGYQKGKNGQTDGQIALLQQMVKNDNEAKYGEVAKNLTQINSRLEKVESERSPSLRLLYILCFSSIALSLWRMTRR